MEQPDRPQEAAPETGAPEPPSLESHGPAEADTHPDDTVEGDRHSPDHQGETPEHSWEEQNKGEESSEEKSRQSEAAESDEAAANTPSETTASPVEEIRPTPTVGHRPDHPGHKPSEGSSSGEEGTTAAEITQPTYTPGDQQEPGQQGQGQGNHQAGARDDEGRPTEDRQPTSAASADQVVGSEEAHEGEAETAEVDSLSKDITH